jgi:hypothetical protein
MVTHDDCRVEAIKIYLPGQFPDGNAPDVAFLLLPQSANIAGAVVGNGCAPTERLAETDQWLGIMPGAQD